MSEETLKYILCILVVVLLIAISACVTDYKHDNYVGKYLIVKNDTLKIIEYHPQAYGPNFVELENGMQISERALKKHYKIIQYKK